MTMDLLDYLDELDGWTTCPTCQTKGPASQDCEYCIKQAARLLELDRPRVCPACGEGPMHRRDLWKFHGWSPGAADNWTPEWGPCRAQR